MSLTYEQISPSFLLDGMAHDPAPGARDGFIAGEWVPPYCRLDTNGVHTGNLTVLDARTDMQAGMEGLPDGVADGADRPIIEEFPAGTAEWRNTRLAGEIRDPVGRVPNLHNAPILGAPGRAAFEARRREYEGRKARTLNTSMIRQRELRLARKVWGTDLAGAGLVYEDLDVTTMGNSLYGGTLWSDPKAPVLDMLYALIDYAADKAKVDGPNVHLLMGETVARQWARNHSLKGVSFVSEGADPVGFQAVMKDSRISRGALVGRLTGGNGIGLEKLARVVIGGARAEFAPKGGTSDVRFIHPDAIHLAVFVPARAFIDGSTVETMSTAMLQTTGLQTGVRMKLDDAENNLMWFADEWMGFNPIDANFGTTIFNR